MLHPAKKDHLEMAKDEVPPQIPQQARETERFIGGLRIADR
jgi:hypothetical protein